MSDEFISTLDLILSDESWIRVINFPMKDLLQYVRRKIHRSLVEANKEKNTHRINELSSIEKSLARNVKDNYDTLLHLVAKVGTVESASLLLQCGANVQAHDKKEKTPIFYAIKNSAEIVRVLLDGSSFNPDLFRQAFLFGTEEIISLLVQKYFLNFAKNLPSGSKFHSQAGAISTQNVEFDQMIIDFLHRNVIFPDRRELFPLLILFAARVRRVDFLRVILDYGKNSLTDKQNKSDDDKEKNPLFPEELNLKGPFGETALHYAVAHQMVQVVQFLLEQGANPNCHDNKRLTPLHFASYLQNPELCRLLLNFGANVNPNFVDPPNPLNLVFGADRREFFRYLETRYLNDTENFGQWNFDLIPRLMKLLLDNGADPDSRSEIKLRWIAPISDDENIILRGCFAPVLIDTCRFGRVEEVKILLEYGANIRALDSYGNSAIHWAARGIFWEMIDFLLAKGLDIDLRNGNNNYTPLMFAVQNAGFSLRMIEYLVYRGANIDAINYLGKTALHMSLYENCQISICLLELGADWSILNTYESLLDNYCYSLNENKKLLISFIALRANKLRNYIKFYVGNDERNLQEAFDYFKKSKREITRLKTTTIGGDFKTTCFDFLVKDFYTCVQISKNSNFRSFFKSKKYEIEFPCYQRLLKYRFKMAQDLKNFVDETFSFVLNRTHLPTEVVEVIMSKLRPIDFRVFGGDSLNTGF